MTKTEQQAIRNVIARLKAENCGCSLSFEAADVAARVKAQAPGLEVVSRIYLDTWVIPALALLLDGPERNPANERTNRHDRKTP